MSDSHVLSGSIVVVLAAICGAAISLRSWNGMSYYYLDKNKRNPAAVKRVFDFSHLQGSALELASQKRLLSEARVVVLEKEHGLVGIELGHFITRSEQGGKEFACHFYNRVELTFLAIGMAVAGKIPSMKVKADCRTGNNINRISAIPLPVSKILEEAPGELELQYFKKSPVLIKFSHVIDQWPRKWSLHAVRLFHQDIDGREVSVGKTQIQQISADNEVKMVW